MKKVLLLLSFVTALMADLEYAENFEAAKLQAQKEHKGVFVILSKEGCDACWYMQNIVFDDDNVVYALDKKYVAVHVDIHEDSVPKSLGYIGTPTMYFLDEYGKKLKNGRIDGAQNVKEFMQTMNGVKNNVRGAL